MIFYEEMKAELIKIKPDLLKIFENREIIVRKRNDNKFQVHWADNSEKPYIRVISDLETMLENYRVFQNGIGKEINDLLSKSDEKKYKSILNIIKQDIWFDSKVHAVFIRDDNKFYRSFKGEKLEDFFTESDLNTAKTKMIDICRKELIESFEVKIESVLVYLENESKWLNQTIQQTKNRKDKSTKFYKHGLKILKDEPTIAMILLGAALELQMKIKYNMDLLEKDTLGILIGQLKKTKKFPDVNYSLLNEINVKYIKAKHEVTTVIPVKIVEDLYQKAIVFF